MAENKSEPAKVASARDRQPALGAEMMAVFRAGREDAWNQLIPAFPQTSPVREQGAPGSPTPQLTTEALIGRDVDPSTDMPSTSLEALQSKSQDQGRSPSVTAEMQRMQGGQEMSRGR